MSVTFKLTANVFFDETQLARDIQGKVERAQKVLDAAVLDDCNYFCPLKTGTLQKSAIINTVIGSGLIVWGTQYAPYARTQYYENLDHSGSGNPNATLKWCETAKVRNLSKWKAIVEKEMKK